MFSSNQVLNISGEGYDQLRECVDFVLKYADYSYESIAGCKEIKGTLVFGWVPKRDDGTFREEYVKEWDKIVSSKKKKSLLKEILNWLKTQENTYNKLWNKKHVGYWDDPVKGFRIFVVEDKRNYPFGAVFAVRPYYVEYAK